MQKLCSIIFFLFLFNVDACSQTEYHHKVDSLQKVLPALKNSARIDCLNELSDTYHWFEADTARAYAKQALREAEKINYITGMAEAYRNLGRVEARLSKDFPAMEKYFGSSLELFLKTGDEHDIAWAWGALGYSKWVLCKFPEAFNAYEKAIKLFEKERDTSNLAQVYDHMSLAAKEWGRYEKGSRYELKWQELSGETDFSIMGSLYSTLGDYETAREYSRKGPSEGKGWQFKYLLIGSTFFHQKQYDSAMHYYQLFADYARAEGGGQLGKFYTNAGEVHLALKQYDSALMYLNKALDMHKKANDRNQVMSVLLLLSKAYNDKEDYKTSYNTVQQLLQEADQTGARQYMRDAHFLLYKLFEEFGNKEQAYVHLRHYNILKDSIDLDLAAQKLLIFKAISKREQQAQSSINGLNDEKKLQQIKLEQTAQQKKFLIVGITAILLIATFLIRSILLKRKNEKHLRELAENELQLQKSESERNQAELKQQAAELEMQALRAQMNPHFIFNCLNAINGFILNSDSETAADYLTKFSRLIRMVLNNSRQKIISLEDELETLNLYLHMERLRFTNNFHYRINCDKTIDAFSIFIPPLLLQPFAENAIWHGLMHKDANGELLIDLHLENDTLHCTITDNGVGRKKSAMLKSKSAEKNKSMGLQITKSRMALLNGDINGENFFEIYDLEDEKGNAAGTKVILKIKISNVMQMENVET